MQIYTGKIIHCKTYFSNGSHGDTQIFKTIFDDKYFECCKKNVDGKYCIWNQEELKEFEYFRKVFGNNGIALADNGYQIHYDPKLRRPRFRIDKNHKCTTLENFIKRMITCGRHVIERINAILKRWKMLGYGRKLSQSEVHSIPDLIKIASGLRNLSKNFIT